jgi:hypothetical protein
VAFTYGDAMHLSAVTAIPSGKPHTNDANFWFNQDLSK